MLSRVKHNIRTVMKSRIAMLTLLAYTGVVIACGVNMYSDTDDVNLGAQLDKEIRSSPKVYPLMLGRPELKSYVSGVVQKVLASPDIRKRAIYPYTLEIIQDDKTVNAFCTPGGYIYVYTGLLKFLDNEATLAGVLGHEIAHAELRHATKRITAAHGAQVLLGEVLGKNPTLVAQIAGNLFTDLSFMKNSRDDEMEADNYSMQYLRSTDYYPGAIKYFFDKVTKDGASGSSEFTTLLLTHPASEERANNVLMKMAEWKIPSPAESQLFTKSYQAFKKKLP
jgi:beta-barrel assembly-enhancing protease